MKPRFFPGSVELSLSLLMVAASASWTLLQAADLSYNTGSTLTLTGAASYDNVRVGVTGGSVATIVNATGTTSFTSNGSTIYVGTNLGSTTSVGRLDLGPLNSLTASTKIVIGGNEPDSDNASNHSGTVTTAAGSVTTIATPLMVLGTSKGTGAFTLGSNATLNLGSTSARTELIISRSDTGNGYNRPANGSMNLSGGTANLNLSSLVIGRKTVGGNSNSTYTGAGTLTLSSSVQNRINISGAGEVVRIGYSTIDLMGPQGTLTIGNLHSDSSITSTDNSTAILLGYQVGAAGNPKTTGTFNFNGGALKITTTGAAIAGGGGGGVSRLYLDGNAKLIAGSDSTNWIHSLTTAEIKSGGATIDTDGKTIGISQAFTGAGGLTKAGTGKLTLSTVQGYSGATNVTGGILEVSGTGSINSSSGITVSSGARFVYNSSVALSKAPTLSGNGIGDRVVLSGNGPIGVALTLDNVGDVLSPGNSPGIQEYTVGQTWNSFSYDWEVNDFSDVTGLTAGSDFDQIAITGALNLTGGTGSYILNVLSLTSGNVSGDVPNFSEINRSWNIITTTQGISGFNAANWTINTTGFTNADAGTWSLSASGGNLVLSYNAIPEPAAAILGSIGMVLLLRRRRAA